MNHLEHSRRYHQPVSRWWWLKRRSYLLYALRELSSLFVAWFVVYLLLLASAIRAGESRCQEFLNVSTSPWLLTLNVIAFLFVVLHAMTWFNQTPQAIVVRIHGQHISQRVIITSMYLLWSVLSAATAWITLG